MQILYRKVIAASIAGTIHSILLGLLFPAQFIQPTDDSAFFTIVMTIIPTYMVYVLPVIFTYGIACSIASDTIGNFISKKSNDRRIGIIVSGSLHIVFGLVLLLFSLIGAVVFFLVDQILVKLDRKYTFLFSVTSLFFPILLLGVCVMSAS
ncbi:hypothetical protein ACFOQM_24225 [Paenibacillus sp. GCM10012307]|uniref:Uncharacterized protein n=1 Tax=Paenibacillus roseus TaxID=2798579 RepID=A0A934MRJ5_9BACL|nr:hypothetical protein [Paenibacillus roseus]MBJ6364331.1 hypothetical protein [Paenibacillus roseus]